MKILVCLSALLCNLVSLKLHTNVKRWVSFGLPVYMRSNFSLRFFSFPIFRNRYNSDMRFNGTLMVLEYTYLFGRNAYFSINK